MKILFTADIHIKLGQKNVPVDWARNRFQLFLDQFAEMQLKADYVIIGGDVFDRLPTMDEVELYFDFVASIKKPGFIIPGNHEMLKKDTTFLSYLKRATHRLNKLVHIIDDFDDTYLPGLVDFIPYNKLKEYDPRDIDLHNPILVTHVRGEIPPHVKPEVPLELFDKWKVVLAGDLHSYENSQRNILYPGSPYTTSFHRNLVDTGAILLDTDTLQHEWLKFNLPQLLKVTVQAGEPTPQTEFHHTIYEIEGDLHELGQLQDSDLIDKKVVKRSQDTQLILDPELSLAEEVREYLTYILELNDDAVQATLKEFYNYADKSKPNVVVWSKPNCPQCVISKQLLEREGLAYEERVVGVNTTREELLKHIPQARAVPQIVVDGVLVGGYQELKEYLLDHTKATKLV